MARKGFRFTPAQILLGSIILTILVGTALLCLPIAQTTYIPFLDNFFMATSATTVTGLNTISLQDYSFFGQCIILLLIQIGGLGLITMTLFMVSLFTDLGFGTQLMAGQLLELESWKNIRKLIFFIIGFTALIEILGTILIFFSIYHEYSLYQALFHATYLSISAFCNAGFYTFADGQTFFQNHELLLVTTSLLILTGGLGFITWHEIIMYFWPNAPKKRATLSLHTKIVLYTSALLIISATALYWILEYHNTLSGMPSPLLTLNAFFNAIACHSAGFSTVTVAELQFATQFIIMLFAFIGSSPGSTGSGIKTTTFAIFVGTVKAAVLGKKTVEIRGRCIARDQVFKALAITILSLSWIIVATFCLLITEKGWEFLDILFEVVSAFATLGLSTGITPYLSIMGKLFIIITMIIGRIGPLTMVLALRKKSETVEYTYPEERVMLG